MQGPRAIQGKGILRRLRRFGRENRGISAVEFALLVPVMVTLFIGGTELTQGITIKRKTTIATRTIADLVAQDTSITNTEMTAIFAATSSVLAPYPASNLKLIVSSVNIAQNGTATVIWSDAHGGATARAAGSPVTLPDGLNAFGNTTLIWAEAEYSYTPAIGYVISGTLNLKDKLYLRPRLVARICRENGTNPPPC
jgi:Flp pilus assembly protein TadG